MGHEPATLPAPVTHAADGAVRTPAGPSGSGQGARHLASISVTALEHLGAADLRAIVHAYRDALAAHREPINRLNVYPVPDGDTGTNMSLTLVSVADDVTAAGDELAEVCKAIAHGSLMGARGNSGVILSQVLRGLVGVIGEAGGCDGATFARAMRAASDAAYQAVMRPVEGTILTVVREAAEAAEATVAATPGATLVAVVDAARDAASVALEKTPELLPVLAEAGVVDAGGTGLLLLFDAALCVIDGRPVPEPRVGEGVVRADAHVVHAGAGHGEPGGDGHGVSDLRYEVMYFLEAPDEAIPRSRTCGPASATRSWWSAATASGTATSTPTTSAPPSRPRSMPAGPARSGSPT